VSADPEKIVQRMVTRALKERLYCCGLLDQDRFIGDDPVGHCCANPSEETVWWRGLNFRLCSTCAKLFRLNSPRLQIPLHHGRCGADE
jgi:hypothetical protein